MTGTQKRGTPSALPLALTSVLIVLLARPRIPILLTAVEFDSEALAPTVWYWVAVGLVSLCIIAMGLPGALSNLGSPAALFLGVFAGLGLLTVPGSVDSTTSLRALATMLFFGIVAICLGSLLSLRSATRALFIAAAAIVGYSALSVLLDPANGLIETYVGPRWRGTFSNQNTLGRWSTLLFILSVGRIISGHRIPLFALSAVSAFSISLATGSDQASGISLAVGGMLILIHIARAQSAGSAVVGIVGCVTGMVVGVALLVPGIDFRSAILGAISGRDGLWVALAPHLTERPWTGFGVGAFWRSSTADSVRIGAGFPASQAHNAYLDALIQFGLVIGTLFAACAVIATGFAVRSYWRSRAAWPIAAVAPFLAIYSFSASMLFASSYEWWFILVLFVGCAYAGNPETLQQESLSVQPVRRSKSSSSIPAIKPPR